MMSVALCLLLSSFAVAMVSPQTLLDGLLALSAGHSWPGPSPIAHYHFRRLYYLCT
jgi:hypothetical protein